MNSKTPFALTSVANTWVARNWTLEIFRTHFQEKELKFRFGRLVNTGVQFETSCSYKYATVGNFLEWVGDDITNANSANQLLAYPSHEYFCYADYKYLIHFIEPDDNKASLLNLFDWNVFGLSREKNEESTFWMGSRGAHTVCHYDTYGWNLVAQLYGRKKWVLFPPDDSPHLYATRVPYEESSVFSQVNVANPDLRRHPRFTKCRPHVVILEPGDVLYVPRHWWHYVECLDTAVSVNVWINVHEDAEERLNEAIVKTAVCALMSQFPTQWLNPTEELSSTQQNMTYVNMALRQLPDHHTSCGDNAGASTTKRHKVREDESHELCGDDDDDPALDGDFPAHKKRKPLDTTSPAHRKRTYSDTNSATTTFERFRETCSALGCTVRPVQCLDFTSFIDTLNLDTFRQNEIRRCFSTTAPSVAASLEENSALSFEDFCNCVVDSDVVDLIKRKIVARCQGLSHV